MDKLFSKSKLEGYRIILIGDSNQHKSVQRGNCLKLLEEYSKIEAFSLTKILRQKSTDQVKAVELLAKGETTKGLDQFQKLGSVIEINNDQDRAKELAKIYLSEYTLNKTPPLVITPTHLDGEIVSQAIRAELKNAGMVGNDKGKTTEDHTFKILQNLNLTEAEKQLVDNYEAGQIIQFKQNTGQFLRNDKFQITIDTITNKLVMIKLINQNIELSEYRNVEIPVEKAKFFDICVQKEINLTKGDWIQVNRKFEVLDTKGITHNLNNGSNYQIKQITKDGNIQFSNDYLIPSSFQNYKSGYYSTSYSAQGQTVKTSLLFCTEYSKPAINRDLVYVSSSRFKNKHFIFVPDFEQFKLDATKGPIKSIGMDIKQDQPSFSQRLEPILEKSLSQGIKMKR